jgi:hypothetical protein
MENKLLTACMTVLFTALLLSACASTGAPVATEIPKGISTPPVLGEIPGEVSASIKAATQELALQLDINPESIQVISVNAAEWPNSCLGAPEPEEMCAEVITPGFGGILEVNGVQYEFRSDETGDQIRIIPEAIQTAVQALAHKLEAESENIRLVSFERMTWNYSCLGVTSPKIECLQVITPGYRVVLQADGEQYVYHTDESGNNIVQAEIPLPGIGDALITFSESDELGCQQVLINSDELSSGFCEGTLTTIPFPMDILEIGDLNYLIEKYAPFEVETKGGKLGFSGTGSEIATEAEQRMITEWARLVKQIAESGRVDPAWGRALVWQREGGIAGFCDDLTVYVTGIALASSCKTEQPAAPKRMFLNADQLEQFYAWLGSLRPFDVEQTDPGTADAMTLALQLEGFGEEEASTGVQQEIMDFASTIYTQATTGARTD